MTFVILNEDVSLADLYSVWDGIKTTTLKMYDYWKKQETCVEFLSGEGTTIKMLKPKPKTILVAFIKSSSRKF